MPKVFITNQSAHDFGPAQKFGTIEFLSVGALSKYSVARMHRAFKPKLEASSQEDYILLTALTVMNVVACCLYALKHKRLNLLLFKDNDYVERRILFEEVENDPQKDT